MRCASRSGCPLSRQEVQRLTEKFAGQDEAHAKQLQEKDGPLAEHQAEIQSLRAQVAAAQADKTAVDDRDYNEAETRDSVIDALLREAGWPLDQERDREYPVTGMPNVHGVCGLMCSGVPTGSGSRSSRQSHQQEPPGRAAADGAVRGLPGARARPSPGGLLHRANAMPAGVA